MLLRISTGKTEQNHNIVETLCLFQVSTKRATMSEGIEGMDGFVTECEQVDIYKNENYKDQEEKKINKVGSTQIKNGK